LFRIVEIAIKKLTRLSVVSTASKRCIKKQLTKLKKIVNKFEKKSTTKKQ